MKYTRVKAVTCALTASVILFGSAAQINATGASIDLPAAGVGLVLEESSSLSSVQEEADQSEKEETAAEAQSAPEVTHEDIESGLTGVGESSIDVEVADHVEEQQMAAAIDNGVGVANVLDTPAVENRTPAETEPVAPVDLMLVQAEAVTGKENEGKAGEAAASDPGRKAEETTPDNSGTEENKEASAESSGEAHKDAEEEKQNPAEAPSEETSEEASENSGEQETEQTTEGSGEQSTEQTTEGSGEQSTEQDTQSAPSAEETDEPSSESSEQSTEESGETDAEPSTQTPDVTDTEQSTEGSEETEAEKPAETETPAQAVPQTEAAPQPEKAPVAAAQSSATVTGGTTGHDVVDFAVQFVGNPYVYGGTSLTNGADCSGFVMSVYENFGVSLPHSSSADRSVGTDVGGLENAQPGDLVCYSGHVGIYIGDNQIVHASTPSTGIKISEADYRTPVAVRRVLN